MAIQNRRGIYSDFDPSRLKPGEFAIVQSGDATASDGKAVYLCLAPGVVKRLASLDELQTYDAMAREWAEEAQEQAENAGNAYLNTFQALERVNLKADAVERLVVNSDQIAANALSKANNLENELADLGNTVGNVRQKAERIELAMEEKADGGYLENGYLILTSNGVPITDPLGPFAGGGGGGSGSVGNEAIFTVENRSSALSFTIAESSEAWASIFWASTENDMPTGGGTLKVMVNGIVKALLPVDQGLVNVDLAKYTTVGNSVVKVSISDTYGNSRMFNFSVTKVSISISSSLDSTAPFTGPISYPFVPVGAVQKTVHILVDGTEIGSVDTPVSGRQLTYTIPAQSHGAHTIQCYYTAEINGVEVQSNVLRHEVICLQQTSVDTIIASPFTGGEVDQYSTVPIEYSVYDPTDLEASVDLMVNGTVVQTLRVDRTRQAWSYRFDTPGTFTLAIRSRDTVKSFVVNVREVSLEIEAETSDLELYLSSYGKSNGQADRNSWRYGSIQCQLTGFNYVSDGWQLDDDGISVLRLNNEARVFIPFQPFAADCRTSGKTISLEFATHSVRDYDAEIITCMAGGRGFKVTAQEAFLKSAQSRISMQYKDDEHLRLDFVVGKRQEIPLIYVYVNGIMSGVVKYPDDDDFSQTTPSGIYIGSNLCGLDLYCIRVYSNALTKIQILHNYICDNQNGAEMLAQYTHNNVFDTYGQIVISNLPSDLPYMIISGPAKPAYKGDKKTVSITYTDPMNSQKSFEATGVEIDVQGTSSAGYPVKNYKIKGKNGFVTSLGASAKYKLRDDSVPVSTFTLKADVASSEGANNVELVRLYNDLSGGGLSEREDGTTRVGIDGFPIVVFWNDGTKTEFVGRYNFNNDKGTADTYGFLEGDESWEVKNNTSDRVIWKNDDYTGTDWLNDFEGRYPDGNTDPTKLAAFASWVKSTENDPDKFKAELSTYCDPRSAYLYWLFTELFLMVDSRAKNAFPTFASKYGYRVTWLPYDMDTALGINNEGVLAFGYALEDTDTLDGGANVFNGQDSVFWCNLRDTCMPEIKALYQELRSSGLLSYQRVIDAFNEHQGKWPEAIFNEDAQFKYLDPYIVDGNATMLSMLQGSKKSQREWWLSNRFRYIDSRFNCGDDLTHAITLRGYAKADITVTPYIDMYVNVKFGSYLESGRAERNEPYTLACPIDNVNDTETYIYSADKIISIGDLAPYQVGVCDISAAEKLQELKLGDSSNSYSNGNLIEVHTGNNPLLKRIDCRNCYNLGTGTMAAIDLSGCTGIEEVYLEGTSVTGVSLPNGGVLETLHLPGTITNLTILNQSKLTDLDVEDYSHISTLRIENVPSFNALDILDDIAPNARVRIIGFDLGTVTVSELADFMDTLDGFRGLDENGNNMERAQVSGNCHITTITGAEMAELNARYPYIHISYDHISSSLKYYSEDGQTLLHTETVVDGGNGTWTGTATKASTAQYSYTFDGWSKSIGGNVASDAKTAVTADRSIYAHFSATIRKYTVTFKNGTTTLCTVNNVPYGGTATYTGPATDTLVDPDGTGQPFSAWNPLPTNIQGTTTCVAQFVPPLTETIEDDWETIIQYAEAGTILDHYQLGDTKILDFGGDAGPVEMVLADVNRLDLADGSGKAKTSWESKQVLATAKRYNPSLETVYVYPEGPSFKVGNGTTGAGNSIRRVLLVEGLTLHSINATASITMTICSDIETSMTIKGIEGLYYHPATRNDPMGFDGGISVNGEALNITSSNRLTERPFNLQPNTPIVIEINWTHISGTSNIAVGCSIRFDNLTIAEFDEHITVETLIGSAPIRTVDHYVEGTGCIGNWNSRELRGYLQSLKPNLPLCLQNALKTVRLPYSHYLSDGSNVGSGNPAYMSEDDLWPLCSAYYQHATSLNGVLGLKTTASGRSVDYWNGASYSTNSISYVKSVGGSSNTSTSSYKYVAVCFYI